MPIGRKTTYVITPVDSPIAFRDGSDQPFSNVDGNENEAVEQWYFKYAKRFLEYPEGETAVVTVTITDPFLGEIRTFMARIIPGWVGVSIEPDTGSAGVVNDILTAAKNPESAKQYLTRKIS